MVGRMGELEGVRGKAPSEVTILYGKRYSKSKAKVYACFYLYQGKPVLHSFKFFYEHPTLQQQN